MSADVPPRSSNGRSGDDKAETDAQSARDADQTGLDTDQTLSDVDQSAADMDELGADADASASARDQRLSSADQRAANRDQLAAERDLAAAEPDDEARRYAYGLSEAQREASTAERAATAALRAQTAEERLDAAERRDEASRLRDLAAEARDRAAEARDRLLAEFEPVGPVAEARAQAAADRVRAAADRARAAADREQAALDRKQVRAALTDAHLDELTGVYRRGLGLRALQREINRARHTGGRLVLAFVDVDGLKKVNDRHGHAAGDALLIHVAATIRSALRSYDPVVRFGGDEFVCAVCDYHLEGVRLRFDQIQRSLEQTRKGCSISVGLAELQEHDTLEDLTARGDTALYDAKRRRQREEHAGGQDRPSVGGDADPPPDDPDRSDG